MAEDEAPAVRGHLEEREGALDEEDECAAEHQPEGLAGLADDADRREEQTLFRRRREREYHRHGEKPSQPLRPLFFRFELWRVRRMGVFSVQTMWLDLALTSGAEPQGDVEFPPLDSIEQMFLLM